MEDHPKATVIRFKELGQHCWLPARFLYGIRCERVMHCKYPERVNCKAVTTEIMYLETLLIKHQERIGKKIQKLVESKEHYVK